MRKKKFLRPERVAYANPPQRGGLAFPQQRRPVRAAEFFNEYSEYIEYGQYCLLIFVTNIRNNFFPLPFQGDPFGGHFNPPRCGGLKLRCPFRAKDFLPVRVNGYRF
jgi:hypothetical protein